MNKIINLLSRKISKEYSISKKDHSDPTDIIIAAYRCAKDLFDINSGNSIATYTLAFYMGHIDEALDAYTRNMNGFKVASSLLMFLINVQKLLNGGSQALQQKLSSELINNSDYYRLFTLDYYLELKRTKGLNAALAELEDDVNTRANTYFNSAYKEYLTLLPGFEEIIQKYTNLK